MSLFDGTTPEYPPLNDVLQAHLKQCARCSESLKRKPVGLGSKPALCSEWFRIIDEWADQEGKANNIVAHDEYGNEASK
jgi:hypothetical protein